MVDSVTAYGWPADLADAVVLHRLLAPNFGRRLLTTARFREEKNPRREETKRPVTS